MTKAPNLLKDIQKIELDPTKQYIMFLPMMPASLDYQDKFAHHIQQTLREQGLGNTMVIMIENPQDIRIIETPTHD